MRTYTRFDASDFEDGVVIFKKVTTDGVASFTPMTTEELQTELGAIDPNEYDADTFLFIKDDGSGNNNIVIPQTVAEMKTALGLPKNIYVAKWYQTGTDAPILSSTRVNTFTTSPVVSFIRDDLGVFGMTTTGLESASIADIEFRDMDESDTKYIKGGYIGANPYLYVREKATGNAIDGFTIMITIKQWA